MDAELINGTLIGLGSEFKSLNAAICARDSLSSFEELHDKLADYELALKHNEAKNEKTTVTAQFNQRSNYNNKGKYSTFNNNRSNKGRMTSQVRNKYPNQGNLNYSTSHGILPSNNQLWCPQPHNQPRIVCQLCDKPSHNAKTCRSQPHLTFSPQANFLHANHGSPPNNSWIIDFGASHHITSDLQNLSLHFEYGGTDDIITGDGKSSPCNSYRFH